MRLINFSLLLGRRSPSHALLVLMVFFPFIFSRTTSSNGSSRHAFHAWRNAPTFNTSSRPGQALPRSAMSSFTSQLRHYLSTSKHRTRPTQSRVGHMAIYSDFQVDCQNVDKLWHACKTEAIKQSSPQSSEGKSSEYKLRMVEKDRGR